MGAPRCLVPPERFMLHFPRSGGDSVKSPPHHIMGYGVGSVAEEGFLPGSSQSRHFTRMTDIAPGQVGFV